MTELSSSFMVEARSLSRAADELAGPGRHRSIEELDAELAVLGRMLAGPLSKPRAAEIRGRSLALVAAMRAPDRPAKPKDATKAGAFGTCGGAGVPGCGAPVIFCRFGNGSTMPIDPLPVADGNVVRTAAGTVRILAEDETTDLPRFRSHFDTCPVAGRFGKRRSNRA